MKRGMLILGFLFLAACEGTGGADQSAGGGSGAPGLQPSNLIGAWDTMVPTGGTSNFCRQSGGQSVCDIDPATPPAECASMAGLGGFTIESESTGTAYATSEPLVWSGLTVTFQTSGDTVTFYDTAPDEGSVVLELAPGCLRQYFQY